MYLGYFQCIDDVYPQFAASKRSEWMALGNIPKSKIFILNHRESYGIETARGNLKTPTLVQRQRQPTSEILSSYRGKSPYERAMGHLNILNALTDLSRLRSGGLSAGSANRNKVALVELK